MTLRPLPELLAAARDDQYAVGYFEAWDSYSLEAVAAAAEAERSPVIIGCGGMMTDARWMLSFGIPALGSIACELAHQSSVPVALLLNEAKNMDQIQAAIGAGFSAVMLDTSELPRREAEAATRQVCELAHERHVAVEGELGTLPDFIDGRIESGRFNLTDPGEAAEFVAATGVDCLAVSVGNVHLLEHGSATIDLDRLKALNERVKVPLVIHGGTGFPAELVPAAIAHGVAKFNVGTRLKRGFLLALKAVCIQADEGVDVQTWVGSHRPGDVLQSGSEAMAMEVRQLMKLYGSSGRA